MKAVVAIDGSKQSQLITQNLKAFTPLDNIVLLNAYEVPQLGYPGTGMSVGHDFSVRAEETLRQEGNRILEEVLFQLPKDSGPIRRQLERGSTAEVILAAAKQENADLIIMGSRGLGVIREHALGSVSHHVSTHASCTTFVAKNYCDSFQHILIPLEQTTDAEQIVSFLSTHPFRGTVKLTLLHVIPFAQPVLPVGALIPESLINTMIEDSQQFTNTIATRLSSLGYVTATVVKTGTPSIVIHEEAQRLAVNMILMQRHTKKKLSRFLLGSVSHSVVHHTTCSILLFQ
ncbi:MAG: universal stress protein [Nitrospirales bacterium]